MKPGIWASFIISESIKPTKKINMSRIDSYQRTWKQEGCKNNRLDLCYNAPNVAGLFPFTAVRGK